MATDIDKLFETADAETAGSQAPAADTGAGDGSELLSAQERTLSPKVQARLIEQRRGGGMPDGVKGSTRKGKAKESAAPAPESSTAEADGDASSGNGLSTQANDELAKLAAKNGETTSTASTPDDSGIPAEIPGLTSGGAEGSAYEKRQAELAAARQTGKKPKQTAKQKAAETARKQKEKDKAAKEKEKERAKAKSDKQKEREQARKEKDKEKQEARKKAEAERKAKLEKERKERAAQRAAKATPDLLKREPKAVQELFAAHYANALEEGVRRAKCDRGDFAAGWMTLLRAIRKDQGGKLEMPAAPEVKPRPTRSGKATATASGPADGTSEA